MDSFDVTVTVDDLDKACDLVPLYKVNNKKCALSLAIQRALDNENVSCGIWICIVDNNTPEERIYDIPSNLQTVPKMFDGGTDSRNRLRKLLPITGTLTIREKEMGQL